MRKEFIDSLCKLAQEDDRHVLLTADLGYGVIEPFRDAFPKRFFNVGCAEQNMISMATGLAKEGMIPWCYSMASFITSRCYEQIRNGPGLHNLPVKIVGVGAGYAYGNAGPTHWALDDFGLMNMIPNMEICCPCQPGNVGQYISQMAQVQSPSYIRLSKGGESDVFAPHSNASTGDSRNIVLCLGNIADKLMQLKNTKQLPHQIIAIENPWDWDRLVRILKTTDSVAIVEEHHWYGGLNQMMGGMLAQNRELHWRPNITQLYASSHVESIGSRDYMLEQAGLGQERLYEHIH